jgi:glycosyltransferase involved in cell wall biosynthesis
MSVANLDIARLAPRTISPQPHGDLRIALVSDSASAKFGGEAIHPVHYFRILRSRGIQAWLVCNERNREELTALFPDDVSRFRFVRDTFAHRVLARLEDTRPRRLATFTFGLASRCLTQRSARALVRQLVREHGVNVVHQPIPLAAKECSLLYNMGAPLVVGPLNGAMEFAPGFRNRQSAFEAIAMRFGRWSSRFMNWLAPGKLRAATVLVANERTRLALPQGITGKVQTLIDNCVDLATWKPAERTDIATGSHPRFLYLGRLVDWKAVDLLVEAFAAVAGKSDAMLDIVGDGPLRSQLEAQAASLGLAPRVIFHGWKSQADAAAILRKATALVLPSLYECGGAVVLEAMASSIAVIATQWGGPADYLDESCGFLVPANSREGFINGLSSAMLKLTADPAMAVKMGAAGRKKVEEQFDWQWKVDRTLEIYADAIARTTRPAPQVNAEAVPQHA